MVHAPMHPARSSGVPAAPPGEDSLPYDFGPNLESDQHRETMAEVIQTLQDWLAAQGKNDTAVMGNMALYFSVRQVQANDFLGPDIMVVRGTTLRKRKSWVCWEEERSPNVVIELLSETTEERDRGDKMATYALVLRTPEYFLFDPIDGRLEGYRLDPIAQAYSPMPPDADGHLAVDQLGLHLGVVWIERDPDGPQPNLRWFDRDGARIPNRIERVAAAERAAQDAKAQALAAERAVQAAQAAKAEALAAEARAARLAEKLRALGLNPEDL